MQVEGRGGKHILMNKNAAIQLALSGISLNDAATLLRVAGSAEEVMRCRDNIRQLWSDAPEYLVQLMAGNWNDIERRADEEREWAERHGVSVVAFGETDYPTRLIECPDAPTCLYVRGDVTLNPRHAISIVGTRHMTAYGDDVTTRLLTDLKQICPDVQVVSGLAFGVDICAHRNAMNNNMQTVAVVAHGHDMLYPAAHRTDAQRMVRDGIGALVTEYPHGARIERRNFLQRNRLIAALSDVTLVVESGFKGGSLVTAHHAKNYGRQVMAVPGSILSASSEGCNNMINSGEAHMALSAKEIATTMGWADEARLDMARRNGIERQMFPDVSPDEKRILDYLTAHGDSQSNSIATALQFSIGSLIATLGALEMKGLVKKLPGNRFHRIDG